MKNKWFFSFWVNTQGFHGEQQGEQTELRSSRLQSVNHWTSCKKQNTVHKVHLKRLQHIIL